MRPALVLALLLLGACRTERTWQTQYTLPPGSSTEVWVATDLADVDPSRPDLLAQSCSVSLLGSDPDLTATVTEYDSWSGACWALVRFELGSGATTSQKASFRFHFELCDDAGCVDFCDAEVCGASASTQDRTVTILLP